MTSELPPTSSPPPPRFRTKMRGYDTAEVDRAIGDLLAEQKRVADERDSLQARLDALGESDLTAELAAVSKDTAEILGTARRAATGMRDRAAADAARWRQEATEAASGVIDEAAGEAEAMRRSAWDTGTQLLTEADAEVINQRSELERETVDRRAESEREAHRHVTLAKREAEDIVSRAKTTAEEALEEARQRHEEIGEQIRNSIEQAEAKVRSLEERRAELVAEAEKTEAHLQSLDDEIAARRERLEVVDLEIPGEIGAGEPLGFRLIPVQPHDEPPSVVTEEQRQVDALTMADEVRRLRKQTEVAPDEAVSEGGHSAYPETVPSAAPSPIETSPSEVTNAVLPPVETPSPEAAEEDEGEVILQSAVGGPGPVPADSAEPVVTASPASDDLAPLFAALRVPDPLPQEAPAGAARCGCAFHFIPHHRCRRRGPRRP